MKATVTVDPLLGATLGGRYLLRESLARHGQLRLYRAEVEASGEQLLATVVSARGLSDAAIGRFFDSCAAMRGDEHPRWTELIDYGREPDGPLYAIEPADAWQDLGRELQRKQRIPVDDAITLCDQLLEGLSQLHARSLSHRGLCPTALRLSLSGEGALSVKLSRGTLALQRAAPSCEPLADDYRPSPDSGGVAADLYAVALLLRQMLCGGDVQHARDAELPEAARPLAPVLNRASAKAGRAYESAEAMRSALAGSVEAQRRFGRYVILHQLARGGMGEILLARAEGLAGVEGLDRLCVIKTVKAALAESRHFVDRFLTEARVLTALRHGNIVPVYDVGKSGGALYIAMEYVFGQDLWRVLRRARERGIRMPVPIALFIARELVNGLAYVHRVEVGGRSGLVHRDVSPQNVMVSYDGETRLIDFGVAFGVRGAPRTREGVVVGKLCYLSPEQARAEPLDQRSDIYAAGLVLFEMLTGQPYFGGGEVERVMQTIADPPLVAPSARTTDISREIDRICLGALAPGREDRYGSAAQLRDDLAGELARIAPRTNPEQVGAFVTELFAEERAARQRLLSRLELGASARGAGATAGPLPTTEKELRPPPEPPADPLASTEPPAHSPSQLAATALVQPATAAARPLQAARPTSPPPSAREVWSAASPAAAQAEARPTGRSGAVIAALLLVAALLGGAWYWATRGGSPAKPAPLEAAAASHRPSRRDAGLQLVVAVAQGATDGSAAGSSVDRGLLAPARRVRARRRPAKRSAPAKPQHCYFQPLGGRRGMQVWIDGKRRGRLPLSEPLAMKVATRHRIRVRYPGYDDFRLTIPSRKCRTDALFRARLRVRPAH